MSFSLIDRRAAELHPSRQQSGNIRSIGIVDAVIAKNLSVLIIDDPELVICAALDGVGLGFVSEHDVTAHLGIGKLVRVLEDCCQPYPGSFIYYPSRRQQTAVLKALGNVLRS